MIRSRNGISRCLNRYLHICSMAALRCIRHNRCRLGGCLITSGVHLGGSMFCYSMLCFRCVTSHYRTRRCNRTDSTGLLSVCTAVFLRLRIVLNRLRLKQSVLLCTVFRKARVCCVLRIGILHHILRTVLCSLRFAIGMLSCGVIGGRPVCGEIGGWGSAKLCGSGGRCGAIGETREETVGFVLLTCETLSPSMKSSASMLISAYWCGA